MRAIVLLCLLYLQGCALVPGLRVSVDNTSENKAYRVSVLTPALVTSLRAEEAATSMPADSVEAVDLSRPPLDYRIGPGDVLTIVVWDHPELTNPTGEFRDPVSAGRLVDTEGMLYYPYVGAFKAAGMTPAEVRDHLIQRLSRVIQNPQIDVRVAAYRSQRVQVTGEVKSPGVITLDDTSKGVLEAINERGGLTPEASRRQAVLVRGKSTQIIDLANLISGARPALNPVLKPGDIVHVPGNGVDQVFVLGEVPRQAPVVLKEHRASLIEALTAAGGLDRLSASDSGVLIFRRPKAEGEIPTVFTLNMSKPEGLLLAGEFPLHPQDVVYVKATAFAQYNAVINQLLPTISAIFQLDRLVND